MTQWFRVGYNGDSFAGTPRRTNAVPREVRFPMRIYGVLMINEGVFPLYKVQ